MVRKTVQFDLSNLVDRVLKEAQTQWPSARLTLVVTFTEDFRLIIDIHDDKPEGVAQ